MAKYDPIKTHLGELSEQGQTVWHTHFVKIEHIIGLVLPPSARKYPEWWANEDLSYTVKSQCRAWAEAGWKTANVDIHNETVSFYKKQKASGSLREQSARADWQQQNLAFRWLPVGRLFMDHKKRLKFPSLTDEAQVYRLVITSDGGRQYYIGETENIRRRVQGYRTPGLTQPTNKRMRNIMANALSRGGKVTIEVLELDEKTMTAFVGHGLGFGNRFTRCLFENAAIIHALQNGDRLLNL